MDFLDYQDFTVMDTTASELAVGDSLPEPMQRLNLSSFLTRPHSTTHDGDFKLPDIIPSDSKSSDNINLYEKMTKYANLSIDALKKSSTSEKVNIESVTNYPIDTGREQSNDKNKIVRDVNHIVSRSSTDLKSLDTKNLILSKKLSKILNDYNANNYHNIIELKKNLKLLEQNKNKISLDIDKLISPEYIGTLSRKTLRCDIETELLKEHITVLEEFRPIVRRIKRFSGPLEKIRQESTAILQQDEENHEIKDKNAQLISRLDKLRSEMELVSLKKKLLLGIKEKFTLNQVEDDIIVNGKINHGYFSVLNKVIDIKEHATYLLALPQDKAGSALFLKANDYLSIINRKIFNYLMDFLYNFESTTNNFYGREDQDDYNPQIFQRGLIYLSNDLEYFKEFLKKVTSIRSKSFLDRFLSQFDPNNKNSDDIKPIILSAHDPIRYISDVLASVHAAIANEADFINSLFKFQNENFDDTPKSILQENYDEFLNGLDVKLLNEIVQSIANTCRIRIEQIIRFEEGGIINFEIVQLLELYHLMFFRKGILESNVLITNIDSLAKISNEKITDSFTNFLKNNVKAIQYGENTDLLPPDWLSDYLNKLVEFFEVYERKGDNNDYEAEDDESKTVNGKMLETIVKQPFMDILLKQLNGAFPLARKNEQIKLSLLTVEINCFDFIKTRLQPFYTSIFCKNEKRKSIFNSLDSRLQEFIEQMKDIQCKILFENTGLGLYNNLLNMIFPVESVQDELDYDMYLSLNENPLMNLDTINENVHFKLNAYLPQALTDIQENLLFKLTSPTIADDISEICFMNLSKFYDLFQKVLIHLNHENKERIFEILNFSHTEFDTLVGIEQ